MKRNEAAVPVMNVSSPGSKEWRVKGLLHREDGPAIEKANGSKEWWVNGQRHREDGPAIERADGSKEWWVNGWPHRENAPAVDNGDGSKEWLVNGLFHREDGPAIEHADDSQEWWINGKQLDADEINALQARIQQQKATELWHRNGKLHREDGPAVEHASGTNEWWINGKRLEADEVISLLERIQQQKATELHKALTEVLTKGFEKDLVAPTTARFKLKVRP